MTKTEAIEELKQHYRVMSQCLTKEDCLKNNEALDMAIEALSAQPSTDGDLISRQAAIDAASRGCKEWRGIFEDVKAELEQLPSAQPSTDGDCISRKAVIELVADYDLSMGQVVKGIHNLPSAQPERKTGRWIYDGYDHPHGIDWMHCSVCGRREPHVPAAMTHYCPMCGAKMEVEHDSNSLY